MHPGQQLRGSRREREKAVYSSGVVRGGDDSLASWLLCLALFPLRVGEWKEVIPLLEGLRLVSSGTFLIEF